MDEYERELLSVPTSPAKLPTPFPPCKETCCELGACSHSLMDGALVQTIASVRVIIHSIIDGSHEDATVLEQLVGIRLALVQANIPDAMCSKLHLARINITTVVEEISKFIERNGRKQIVASPAALQTDSEGK